MVQESYMRVTSLVRISNFVPSPVHKSNIRNEYIFAGFVALRLPIHGFITTYL